MARVKFLACQAHSINQYKNIINKVLKCYANIYFNRQCLKKHVTTYYNTAGWLASNKLICLDLDGIELRSKVEGRFFLCPSLLTF
jgi:hypothetical protein